MATTLGDEQITAFASTENVITMDRKVQQVKNALRKDNYELLKTVIHPTHYIVIPAESLYQTAEVVISMVAKFNDKAMDLANVHVPINYNRESGQYSAGEISIKYQTLSTASGVTVKKM